jgi:hypothetical protein
VASYRDDAVLGSGGFGEVWRVIRDDGEPFAKKLLDVDTPEAIKRFQREVRILTSLDHPRIVRIVDTQLVSQPYSYLMPIYRGSLRGELSGVIGNDSRIAKIFGSILEGMNYAHQQGVLHRDLKPENILMNNDDDLVISDFGLGRAIDAQTTRATFTGQGMGTLGYLSPEQADSAKDVDYRTDIFALGRMLYEMYSGHSMLAPQDLSSLPIGVTMIIDRCTKRDPDHRYQSVSDLRIAFDAFTARRGEITANERARELVAKAITEQDLDSSELEELAELIGRYQEDVDLLHELGMQIPVTLLEQLFERHQTAAEVLTRTFTTHATSQGWGYEYTDKIAGACNRFYDAAVGRPDLRALLIQALVEIGVNHNRFYVMDVAAGVIARIQDDEEAKEVAHELIKNQDQLEPIGGRLKVRDLRPALKELFESLGL